MSGITAASTYGLILADVRQCIFRITYPNADGKTCLFDGFHDDGGCPVYAVGMDICVKHARERQKNT